MPWTEETTATAGKLWLDGFSASQIAKQLGEGLTRNSVIGKLHRMGLMRAEPTDPSALAAERRQANAESCRKARARRAAEVQPAPAKPVKKPPAVFGAASPVPKPPTPLKQDGVPGPHSTTLLLIGRCRCMYPVGTATGADQLFCGEPAQPGRSYCAGHARVCGGSQGGRVRA